MPRRSCDGAGFLAAFRSAVAALEANVDEINALNVFPVPDGDTGTNMLATVRAALEEADKAGPDADAARRPRGELRGADGRPRQLRGDHQPDPARHRGRAWPASAGSTASTSPMRSTAARRQAYKAVAKPVEGTILTVIREAAAAAVAAAERDNNVETVLAATVDAAERAVAKTPSLLPILREAHVVDSGGQGLFRAVPGRARRPRAAGRCDAGADERRGPGAARRDRRRTDHVAPGAIEDRRVRLRDRVPAPRPRPAARSTSRRSRRHLEAIGDSVLVAGDDRDGQDPRPQRPPRRGDRLRPLDRDALPDHDREPRRPGARRARGEGREAFLGGRAARRHVGVDRDRRRDRGGRRARAADDPDAERARPACRWASSRSPPRRARGALRRARRRVPGVRARSASCAAARRANPSTGELLEAVEATPADELLILPNNPNVILAARQVASMTDRPIHVVPTRNCAEGFAALLELDPSDPGRRERGRR